MSPAIPTEFLSYLFPPFHPLPPLPNKTADMLTPSVFFFFRNSTDKRTLIENYDLVSLAIDEIIDDGIILEVDPVVVASRVTRPPAQDVSGVKGIDLSEQGIMNAWELLKAKGVERIRQL